MKKDGEKLKAGRDMHIDVEKHRRIYYCSNMKKLKSYIKILCMNGMNCLNKKFWTASNLSDSLLYQKKIINKRRKSVKKIKKKIHILDERVVIKDFLKNS